MHHVYTIVIASALLSSASVLAQVNSTEQTAPCIVMPIFHCLQKLEEGGAIGHFGYELQCPDDAGAVADVYLDINDNNQFSPGRKDRGQPKSFMPGVHIDEFEVDLSTKEVKAGSVISWSVLGQTVMVDYSKKKDKFLDCSSLSQ